MTIKPVAENLIEVTTRHGVTLEIMDSDELGIHIRRKGVSLPILVQGDNLLEEPFDLGSQIGITLRLPLFRDLKP